MFCYNCKKELDADEKYCPFCGVLNKSELEELKTIKSKFFSMRDYSTIIKFTLSLMVIFAIICGFLYKSKKDSFKPENYKIEDSLKAVEMIEIPPKSREEQIAERYVRLYKERQELIVFYNNLLPQKNQRWNKILSILRTEHRKKFFCSYSNY